MTVTDSLDSSWIEIKSECILFVTQDDLLFVRFIYTSWTRELYQISMKDLCQGFSILHTICIISYDTESYGPYHMVYAYRLIKSSWRKWFETPPKTKNGLGFRPQTGQTGRIVKDKFYWLGLIQCKLFGNFIIIPNWF